jgi:DNA replication and repair protein RecF
VLAENLPLQVLSSDTFKLLEGAPKIRRQFMDWGVFHVEQGFHGAWKNAQRCLKQRNSLLRRGRIDPAQLQAWSQELVSAGEQLHSYREHYFSQFLPQFASMLSKLTDLEGLSLEYFRGWEKAKTLAQSYSDNSQKDIDRGYTGTGHHRADLRLKCQSMMAVDILSRGQQKLVVCAMRLAQGYLLSALRGKRCVFLVDDLPAELDRRHRKALCELLEQMNCQVFVTCVDYQDVENCWQPDTEKKLFHVEHGKVSLVV